MGLVYNYRPLVVAILVLIPLLVFVISDYRNKQRIVLPGSLSVSESQSNGGSNPCSEDSEIDVDSVEIVGMNNNFIVEESRDIA